MTDQVWDWKAHLDPFERARVRQLDSEIKKLDDRRAALTAERQQLVSRGRHRARNQKRADTRRESIAGQSGSKSAPEAQNHRRLP